MISPQKAINKCKKVKTAHKRGFNVAKNLFKKEKEFKRGVIALKNHPKK